MCVQAEAQDIKSKYDAIPEDERTVAHTGPLGFLILSPLG